MTSQKTLRVGLIQGGKIVEERLLENIDQVTLGPDPSNTFVIRGSNLPSFPVFVQRAGSYQLVLNEKMDGRVRIGESDMDFASLRNQGLAKKRGAFYVLPLNENSKGKISLGEITLLFQFVKPPPGPVRTELPPTVKGSVWQATDHLFFFILAGSLIVHFSGAGYLACLPKSIEQELSLEELPDRFARVLIPTKPPEKRVVRREAPAEEKKEAAKEEAAAPKAGKKAATTDPAARRAEVQQRVATKGLLKILGSSGSRGGGAFQDVLGGGTGSGDIASALAGAGGVGVATSESLARAGGQKGGGSGTVAGIGSVGTRGGGNVNLGAKGDVRVVGQVRDVTPEVDSRDVDRDALARYVRQRLKAIQNCYEKELKRNPSLKGKVVVRFSITPTGRAGEIEVEENSMGNEAVASCLRTVIRGWIFPFKPPDNISVAYPFLFSPAS